MTKSLEYFWSQTLWRSDENICLACKRSRDKFVLICVFFSYRNFFHNTFQEASSVKKTSFIKIVCMFSLLSSLNYLYVQKRFSPTLSTIIKTNQIIPDPIISIQKSLKIHILKESCWLMTCSSTTQIRLALF